MASHSVGIVSRIVSWGLLACIASCADASDERVAQALASDGTGISATTTATGFYERRITYDWTLVKSATPTRATLGEGDHVDVQYTLAATRAVASDEYVYGTRGEVCVTNEGSIATEGLAIVDQVQIHGGPGGYVDLAGAYENVPVDAQLAAGETHCYPYEVAFTPVAAARYRNTARVTITNHSGHLGVAFGPGGASGVTASFTLPTTYTTVYRDAESDIADVPDCATGLSCSPSSHGPWHLTDSDSIVYTTTVTRMTGVACGIELTVSNEATLTESTSNETRTSSADVVISTGVCPLTLAPGQGCTPGYWKNHPVSWSTFWPSSPVSSVFPASAAYDLGSFVLIDGLAYRGGSDDRGAAEILLRAAIAALLNAAHPDVDYPRSTAQVLADVNAALTSDDRATMITLASALDRDNNLGCPLH
jgi:hypothetical protein